MTNAFYNHDDGYPALGAQGASSAMRAEFDKIAAGFDSIYSMNNVVPSAVAVTMDVGKRGNLINYTAGGFTQNLTAAATLGNGWYVYVKNSGLSDIIIDPNGVETIDGATVLPLHPGESKLIACSGSGFFSVIPSNLALVVPRSANTILDESNNTNVINYTVGSFTQTIKAAALLGNGWRVWLRNSSGTTVTIDPNGAETINGAATYALVANSSAMLVCDGANFLIVGASSAPAASPALILLTTVIPTAAATFVDLLNVFTSSYDDYLIQIDGVLEITTASQFFLRLANAGVADATAAYYVNGSGTATGIIPLCAANVQLAGMGITASVMVNNVNSSTAIKLVRGTAASQSTTSYVTDTVLCAYNKTSTVSGFRLLWNGGVTFAGQGIIRVYGYTNV